MKFYIPASIAILLISTACSEQKWTELSLDDHNIVSQPGGPTLGYSPDSGVEILTVDGHAFKDLDRDGELDPYEDWRRPLEERVNDLTDKLSIEEIAGLMLYSNHQSIPAAPHENEYDGKNFADSGAKAWDLTDSQKKFLKNDNLRHVLVTSVESPEAAARWNNRQQAFVEGLGHGIPANNSTDPRHNARADAEFNAGGGGKISMWPGSLGLAATFDPALVRKFAQIASEEYRALGFATALSPQIDIATEPRWMRFSGTFGEDPALVTDMARAYCDGMQSSPKTRETLIDGWGPHSVNAMVKHWPGGGACEAGRDAHYGFGKYSVFPGGNLASHKLPFTEGAFRLEGATKCATAVMPYYTISYGQTKENVANSFSKEVITGQLRGEAGFDGVICTDWGITADETHPGVHSGKPWGVEQLTVAQRHYKALMAGVDQFGGNNDMAPVLEAYEMGVKEHGKEWMDRRMRESARRLLANIFRTGLFENPYLEPRRTSALVGCADYMARGYEAQLKSVVMLKNHDHLLPMTDSKLKVYIPTRRVPAYTGFWGNPVAADTIVPLGAQTVKRYFDVAATPDKADFAIVFIESPNSGYGYSLDDAKNGGNGYLPISLQYSDYTATEAREQSIAGGDPYEDFTNRSYRGKSVKTINRRDMETLVATKIAMGDKPVILVVNMLNPMVMSEVEPYADAVFATFDVQNQVILDLVSGRHEPSGLLPMQLPADMATVEAQNEDTPRDMRPHRDADGNLYDFAFGMNWKGRISDSRTEKYK